MKKSRFNLLVEKNEEHALLFNFYSRGFLELSRANYEKFENLNFSPEDELLKGLKKGFFIQDDDVDELAMFDARNKVLRYSTSHSTLTIVPTSDCNFSCEYCFSVKKKEYMSQKTENEVIEFFEKGVNKIRSFHVCWFGGEPLLAKTTMDRLSREFIRRCEESKVPYSSILVTNGYLLTKENIDWLKEIKVEQLQVTLDGDEAIHDRRRKLLNGGSTFRVIMDNLRNAAGNFRIIIRVNFDKNNVEKVRELLPVLEKYGIQDKVSVYYGSIISIAEVCKDYESNCLDIDTVGNILLDFHKDALDKNQKYVSFPFPLTMLGGCGAMKPGNFIIDPQGYLHKCLNTVGTNQENIGHVSQQLQMTPRLAWWLTWDPIKEKECKECQVLPLCGGGCPYTRSTGQHTCTYYKTSGFMTKLLQIYYRDVYLKGQRKAEGVKA